MLSILTVKLVSRPFDNGEELLALPPKQSSIENIENTKGHSPTNEYRKKLHSHALSI